MKIILAAPRGFCAGVNMAIESLDLAIRAFGTPVFVYHEIVHNQYVVDTFKAKGAVFVDSLQDVPPGATLLFSAHGVSPEIRRLARERRLRAIDATCPLVTKVHIEAVRFAQEGYTILLIGHEGHDETIGTMGEAPQAIVLVESVEDADRLSFPPDARNHAFGGRRQSDYRPTESAVSPACRPPQGGHLLCHAKSARGRAAARRRGRFSTGARQPKQFEQPAPEGVGY
jgi:(E)-4-hydroxy-3-methyl-but-2-enyl pyrophosphate reductase